MPVTDSGSLLDVNNESIGYYWQPITDLSEADLKVASTELPALQSTWEDVRGQLDSRQLDRFNERLKREWAIETGIIERIYTLDHGTTQLLIKQGIDASLIAANASDQPPELVAAMIQDHATTVDWLFDTVTEQRPLSTSFVKQLHALMTRKQKTASGFDSLGQKQDIKLLHGTYKEWPNNPVRTDGKLHQYCPPEQVTAEMDRLIELHQKHQATNVATDVSAAWLHHRFTQIHPFQDGNGRVARAIASLVLISAQWFPLVVTRDDRVRYIEALVQADEGNLASLTRLVAKLQRKQFVRALSIAEEVQTQDQQLEQMLEIIGDMFNGESNPANTDRLAALDTAKHLREICGTYFEETATKLQSRLADSTSRKAWSEFGVDADIERRRWNRYQIVHTAQTLDYFANTRDHHEWVRLAIITENGRAEILTSFHAIGTEYRGLVGVSMCFYRRQQADNFEQQVIELQPVSDELFQINYRESADSVKRRFMDWLEQNLVLGLDQWRRGE